MTKKEKLPESEEVVREALQEEEEIEEKELTEEAVAAIEAEKKTAEEIKSVWKPRTELGRKVLKGQIANIDEVLDKGVPIFEIEIVDLLLHGIESDLLMIGQAKGKFGGGQRRVFKQTQKKTAEGNKPNFAVCAVVGNKNGYFGVGHGKSKETVPAREKALRRAKLNIRKIRRGCGSWECGCKEAHSIPFAVEGKCGSIRLKLVPAPKGKGLIIQEQLQKILKLAGVKDIWSKAYGDTRTTLNVVYACVDALNKLVETKIKEDDAERLGVVEGMVTK